MRLYVFLIILACWLGLGASFNEARGNGDLAYNGYTNGHSLSEQKFDAEDLRKTTTAVHTGEDSEIQSSHSSKQSQSRERNRVLVFAACTQYSTDLLPPSVTNTKKTVAAAGNFPDRIRLLLYPKHSFW